MMKISEIMTTWSILLFSSNRAMQTIINNALAEGVTHKDLKTGKYHQGPDGSADDSAA